MNDVLRIARLKIALQRAFLGRAILIFTDDDIGINVEFDNDVGVDVDVDVCFGYKR